MRINVFLIILLAVFFKFSNLKSQTIVNGYAKVSSISGTTINIDGSNMNLTNDTFVAGEKAVIMQMQDDVIGSTTDDSSFGDIGSILSAGLYEVVTISTVNGAETSPTSIEISGSLTNSYNTGSNSSVQIITYPVFDDGSGDYTTTSDIIAVEWDGNIGGVIAFKVEGTLTLLHNISADGAGFNGAAANGGATLDDCYPNVYHTSSGSDHADKGEGIYNSADVSYAAARGKILNGGGGGNSHNGGGGGGGNYSAGGDGGPGWASGGDCETHGEGDSGGLGGIALSSYISSSRIFMGGGGGSGEGNNDFATDGANGGGIILISASTLETTTGCLGVFISANGNDASSTSGNDGAGGAGAGGSIVLEIDNFNVNASCQLTVEANGGTGGSVNHDLSHGGGGGGGMGVVIYSIPTPTTNITTNTDPGTGGKNDNTADATTAPSGGGTSGTSEGVVDESETPLPVELINFKAHSENENVILTWKTVSETNNDYFDIQMSRDGRNFANIGKVDGYGTTNTPQDYQFSHFNSYSGISYYRLRQVDFDGQYEYSKTIFVNDNSSSNTFLVDVYPNPVKDKIIRLKVLTDMDEDLGIVIKNSYGAELGRMEIDGKDLFDEIVIDGHQMKSGFYFLDVSQGNYHEVKKIIVN